YGSDTVWGNRVTDLLRWGSEIFPENRSLRAVVKSTRDASRSAFYAVQSGTFAAARSVRAFAVARPGPTAIGAAVALALGASAFGRCATCHPDRETEQGSDRCRRWPGQAVPGPEQSRSNPEETSATKRRARQGGRRTRSAAHAGQRARTETVAVANPAGAAPG